MLYPLSMLIESLRYLIREKSRFRAIETLSVLLFPLYFLFLFFLMGFWQAILVTVIHRVLFGLYISSVFVPNHMGMPILDANENPDFLRQQVLTSRNVKGHPLVDFLFGGLNYQIEHHLFPKMPRNRLRKARELVQEFLQEKSIAYHETGVHPVLPGDSHRSPSGEQSYLIFVRMLSGLKSGASRFSHGAIWLPVYEQDRRAPGGEDAEIKPGLCS